jgi:hypothetical protein
MMSLDDDLAAWAATVRLPDAEAAAISQRIARTPTSAAAITPQQFTAGFTARMIASTRPARLAA